MGQLRRDEEAQVVRELIAGEEPAAIANRVDTSVAVVRRISEAYRESIELAQANKRLAENGGEPNPDHEENPLYPSYPSTPDVDDDREDDEDPEPNEYDEYVQPRYYHRPLSTPRLGPRALDAQRAEQAELRSAKAELAELKRAAAQKPRDELTGMAAVLQVMLQANQQQTETLLKVAMKNPVNDLVQVVKLITETKGEAPAADKIMEAYLKGRGDEAASSGKGEHVAIAVADRLVAGVQATMGQIAQERAAQREAQLAAQRQALGGGGGAFQGRSGTTSGWDSTPPPPPTADRDRAVANLAKQLSDGIEADEDPGHYVKSAEELLTSDVYQALVSFQFEGAFAYITQQIEIPALANDQVPREEAEAWLYRWLCLVRQDTHRLEALDRYLSEREDQEDLPAGDDELPSAEPDPAAAEPEDLTEDEPADSPA